MAFPLRLHTPRAEGNELRLILSSGRFLRGCVLMVASGFAQGPSSHNVALRIIVVNSASEAQNILEKLKQGEDFAALAKAFSTDATSADGGYMGQFDPSSLRSEIRGALKDVVPGHLTAVIHLPSGYAILQVLPSAPAAPPAAASSGTDNSRILPYTASGTIRYQQPVGGKGEADLGFRTVPKPEGWSQDLAMMCRIRQQSLQVVMDIARENLDPNNLEGSASRLPVDRIQMHYALANLYAYKGEMAKAHEQWLTAYQIARNEMPAAMPDIEEALSMAYLHEEEMDK